METVLQIVVRDIFLQLLQIIVWGWGGQVDQSCQGGQSCRVRWSGQVVGMVTHWSAWMTCIQKLNVLHGDKAIKLLTQS